MTDQDRIDLIHYMFREWKATMKERMALRAFLTVLSSEHPEIFQDQKTRLDGIRNSEELKVRFEHQFAGFEEVVHQAGEDTLGKMARDMAEKFGSRMTLH